MIKTYILSILMIACGLAHGQVLENSFQNFQGVFYGDIAVADLNQDGKPDFVITGAKPGFTGYSTTFLNENGSFIESQIPDFPQLMYSSLALEDINNDGKKDILITGTNTFSTPQQRVFEIYIATAFGGFIKKENIEIMGVNNGSIQVADFNGDGRKDILVNGNADQPITKIYFQQVDGSFTDANLNLLGSYYSATKVFDANGDGHPDVLITGYSSSYIVETKLYINDGTGEFTEKISGLPPVYFSSIDTADIDNDGDTDLLIAGMDMTATYTLQIYLNDGTGNFVASANTFSGTATGTAKFVDYNNDGLLDIFSIGTNANNENKAQLYKNLGNQTFEFDSLNSNAVTGLNMAKSVWFDTDDDGDQDLITIGFDGTTALTKLYTNTTIGRTCGEPGNNPGDTGCITFNYDGEAVTYTTVRGTDGNIWLQQNLGSSKVADQINDEPSYGDLFQWGRWADGHQKRNSALVAVPTPNNPLGIAEGSSNYFTGTWWTPNSQTDKWEAPSPAEASDINGCDPCRALGQGWRIPNEAEWIAIKNSENITNPASALASNLKLPGNGYRSNTNGSFTFVGARGYYWSTTPSSTGGKYLYVGSVSANASAGAPRGQGAALRCLKLSETAAAHCTINIQNNAVENIEPITYVGFASIQNSTSGLVGGTSALQDFTSTVANVTTGNIYSLIVKGNTNGVNKTNHITAYFDWNQNGNFNDVGESFYLGTIVGSTGTDNEQIDMDIEIPTTAITGNTKMRIIKDAVQRTNACDNILFGQAEDYTINVEHNLGTGNFDKNNIQIYPNPTSGIVTIQTNAQIDTATVYNQFGQLLLSGKTTQLNLESLSSGIYILKIKFDNGQTATQKIIKK